MKPTLILLVCALLAVGMPACGGTHRGTEPAGAQGALTATLPKIETKDDPDDDSDRYPHERPDRDEVPNYRTEPFGHPAAAADARALTALVTSYYAAAAHGNAAAACRLLYAPRREAMTGEDNARGLHLSQASVACALVLGKLFAEQRPTLRAQDATLGVGAVRSEYNTASVQLYFGHPRASYYIEARRERGVWKLEILFAIDRPVGVE